jgi:hypothetical protein
MTSDRDGFPGSGRATIHGNRAFAPPMRIHYASLDELDRLLGMLGAERAGCAG